MNAIHLLRHGPKNNDPNAHGTGVEAGLDPKQAYKIITHAALLPTRVSTRVSTVEDFGYAPKKIQVVTSPIDRAIGTGQIVYDIIKKDSRFVVPEPAIDDLINSSGRHPQTGKAINLSPKEMSKIWGEAKRSERYSALQGENKPLYAWCEQGFDNPQANAPNDPGISLREIACRLGSFVYQTLQNADNSDVVIGYSHSGDLEPFLYLCLEMLEGKDGSDPESMTRRFEQTRGALEPLDGIFLEQRDGKLHLNYNSVDSLDLSNLLGYAGLLDNAISGKPHNNPVSQQQQFLVSQVTIGIRKSSSEIGLEIFQEMDHWLKNYGRSQQVLEAKLGMGK